jgi:hypothetical protein
MGTARGMTEGRSRILKVAEARTSRPDRRAALLSAAARGALAGSAGVLAMTLAEKAEQAVSGRANSYVPARALRTAAGRWAPDTQHKTGWNHAMHWMTGMLLGALRGVWAVTGIRGPAANATHTVVRLAFDQTAENVTGVGAPPGEWPRAERLIDASQKTIYSFVTGWVADRWIAACLTSRRGAVSH